LDNSEKLQVLSIDPRTTKLEANPRFQLLDLNQQQSIRDLRNILGNVHQQLTDELAAQRTILESMQHERFTKYETNYIEKQHELDQHADSALLKQLWFDTLTTRREEIAEAHKNTFAWIFEDPKIVRTSGDAADNTRPWSNFVEWLQHGEGLYWINGKAGSGKSTLMRYIVEGSKTLEHLQKWAGPAELQVESFYFWNGGSPEQ
jgi:Tfp pilus assembly pilus retraction ATPase PilT